ncbi:hypothetical protein PK98_00165 [Croceibacterium mercuriale]|uniref:Uncharacterized protein n=1 Tax=Croceibacterium mercuriale TaxID=1572751 RepID=A0A0B2BZ03_9SPHN|nr:hypothetical protein [Croceibacterium mercuriale]KHL25227.1 hypothetical protein PK98_00165 [Croceibacterium mercuriale]
MVHRVAVPQAKPDPALRDRFEQLLGGGRSGSRPDRGTTSSGKAGEREKQGDAAQEGNGEAGLAGLTGALSFREPPAGDPGGDALSFMTGQGGGIQLAAPTAAEVPTAPSLRSADPAMMQLAERIASLHLPSSGSYHIELPGSDRVAARVEHAGQGGFAIALHLPAKATEHRRRLAAELSMHLDARGLTRCVVRLEDEQPGS